MASRAAFAVLVAAAVGSLSSVAFADEVVKFTNGAEMPVVSHTVEKGMVKLDLGNNSFIAFPMSMVDKIINAGHDVFLNPTFHLSNQAVAAGAGTATGSPFGNGGSGGVIGGSTVANSGFRGGGNPGGQQAPPPGTNGAMLGEAADILPQDTHGDPNMANADVNKRRIYNPAFNPPPGGMPQVIMPPSVKAPGRMVLSAPPRVAPPQPTIPQNPPENSPPGDPAPQDPGDNNN